jgi:peptidoglycan-associated lipoprotein
MKSQWSAGLALTALSLALFGCAKHVASAPPHPTVTTPASAAPAPATSAVAARTPRQQTQAADGLTARLPDAQTRARIQDLLNRIQDAYFDYDKHTLRPDAQSTLMTDAKTLSDIIRQYPDFKLNVEGHCDERGSEEYNLALGDARAKQSRQYLATLGLPGEQLRDISYGKDRPVCSDHDEQCWQRNRRAHLSQEQ